MFAFDKEISLRTSEIFSFTLEISSVSRLSNFYSTKVNTSSLSCLLDLFRSSISASVPSSPIESRKVLGTARISMLLLLNALNLITIYQKTIKILK